MFIHNAQNFWQWFSLNQHQIQNKLLNEPEKAVQMMKEPLSEILPEFVLECYMKKGISCIEFISMGNPVYRTAMAALISLAPSDIKHFKFYNTRMPKYVGIVLNNQKITGDDVEIQYKLVNNRVKLNFQCSKLSSLEERDRFAAFYSLLYDYIGESLTETAIASVQYSTKLKTFQKNIVSLSELEQILLNELKIDNSNQNGLIYDYYYSKPMKNNSKPREDITEGYSAVIDLAQEFYSDGGETVSLLSNLGFHPAYIQLPLSLSKTHNFEKIKENLILELNKGLGILIGFAKGVHSVYFDILLYDKPKSKMPSWLDNAVPYKTEICNLI